MSADKEETPVEMEVDGEGGDADKSNAAASATAESTTPAAAKGSDAENGKDAKADGETNAGTSDKNVAAVESSASSKKRPRSPSESADKADDQDSSKIDSRKKAAVVAMLEVKKPESSAANTRDSEKISVASVAAASQLSSAMGWNGLFSLLNLSLLTNNGNSSTSSSNDRGRSSRASPAASGGSSSGSSSGSNNSGSLPLKDQVLQAAIKAVNDAPPFVHLSKTDSAPQLKITNSVSAQASDTAAASDNAVASAETAPSERATDASPILVNDRLACQQGEGEMRGYRMTRASHGVAAGSGNFYYEVVILKPPTARELVNSLPPNVRLGKKLQREMEKALMEEEEAEREEKRERENESKRANETAEKEDGDNTGAAATTPASKTKSSSKSNGTTRSSFGAHVRLGWSMRTGDLQAPVGYDKWSYGIRDIQGSKIHCSKREDNWGGEEFGAGDVVGCMISMVSDGTEDGGGSSSENASTANSNNNANDSKNEQDPVNDQQPQGNENHIRFFKNGLPMGEFVITKGKREGGAAFIIPNGVYYPAISLYMGATVKVNFGPHFIHPPRKLPSGMSLKSSKKKGAGGSGSSVFQPISNLCKAPLTVEEASAKVAKEQKTLFFRKADNTAQQKRFQELVETEVGIQQEAYQNHRRKHILDVMEERKQRKLKYDDLEQDEFFAKAATGGSSGSSS